MSRPSFLSDELLGHLMAVGQVDILVGVPTLDNAATIRGVARAVHRSFATHFLRQRTVLLNCDGGSTDGTPDIVRNASLKEDETLTSFGTLRTVHHITTPYHGLPGKGSALRTLFAAADLLQARAVAVFDPEVTSITPDWVDRLLRPVWEGRADFVTPAFSRHPCDGLLVTQLVRPLFGAAYGHRVGEPLASELACSGAFAAHAVTQDVWDGPLARYGIDLWLTGAALAGGFRIAEAPLGRKVLGAGAPRPGLPAVFGQVVGALFGCLEAHEAYWLSRTAHEPVPLLGEPPDPAAEGPDLDPRPMLEAFRSGVRDLDPVLRPVLEADTMDALGALAADPSSLRYPDDLWTDTVLRAAAAYRRGLIHRDHLLQALVPLYLGRAAAFLLETAGAGVASASERLEEIARRFDAAKAELVRRWAPEGVR